MREYRTYTNKDGGINDTSALTFAAISRTDTGSEATQMGLTKSGTGMGQKCKQKVEISDWITKITTKD